jgi:hypothetical protein
MQMAATTPGKRTQPCSATTVTINSTTRTIIAMT